MFIIHTIRKKWQGRGLYALLKECDKHARAYFSPSQIPAQPLRDLDPAQNYFLQNYFGSQIYFAVPRQHCFISLVPSAKTSFEQEFQDLLEWLM